MNNTLETHAQTLRLSGLLESLPLRLQEAQANRLPYEQFLELVLQDEINVRHQRLINRRQKQADRSLDNFDFSSNPTINRAQIYQLAAAHFVTQRRDVLLVGPPGVEKSHLVQAIGREVLKAGHLVLYRSIFDLVRELLEHSSQLGEGRLLKKYLKPDLLIIDDMGLKILPQKSGEILLEIIMRRYENRSTMMTSNRPIEEWGKLLSDVPAASAILDQLLHDAEIIPINGRSYRLQSKARAHPSPNAPQAPVQGQIRHNGTLPPAMPTDSWCGLYQCRPVSRVILIGRLTEVWRDEEIGDTGEFITTRFMYEVHPVMARARRISRRAITHLGPRPLEIEIDDSPSLRPR